MDQKLFGQHDIRWIPEGHLNAGMLMVFNNSKFGNEVSAVDIWQPPVDAAGHYFIGYFVAGCPGNVSGVSGTG